MKYAIELYFDRETEKILFDLSQRVAEEGISMKFSEWKTRPHLTLACYNDLDEQKCIEQLKQFAQRYKSVPRIYRLYRNVSRYGNDFHLPRHEQKHVSHAGGTARSAERIRYERV